MMGIFGGCDSVCVYVWWGGLLGVCRGGADVSILGGTEDAVLLTSVIN